MHFVPFYGDRFQLTWSKRSALSGSVFSLAIFFFALVAPLPCITTAKPLKVAVWASEWRKEVFVAEWLVPKYSSPSSQSRSSHHIINNCMIDDVAYHHRQVMLAISSWSFTHLSETDVELLHGGALSQVVCEVGAPLHHADHQGGDQHHWQS